jgi:hypothetical protein
MTSAFCIPVLLSLHAPRFTFPFQIPVTFYHHPLIILPRVHYGSRTITISCGPGYHAAKSAHGSPSSSGGHQRNVVSSGDVVVYLVV